MDQAAGTQELLTPGKPSRLLRWCMLCQLATAAVVLLVPFGFDKPSAWGLDFDDLLVLLVLYAVALLVGLVATMRQGKWAFLALQLAIPAAFAGLIAGGRLHI